MIRPKGDSRNDGSDERTYYTDEDVIGSKYKYHGRKCPRIRT
jgi:hypothetical protein